MATEREDAADLICDCSDIALIDESEADYIMSPNVQSQFMFASDLRAVLLIPLPSTGTSLLSPCSPSDPDQRGALGVNGRLEHFRSPHGEGRPLLLMATLQDSIPYRETSRSQSHRARRKLCCTPQA